VQRPADHEIVAYATEPALEDLDGRRRTMTDSGRAAFENALIEDMRAHRGAVTNGPLAGDPLLVMTCTGAKTGDQRRAILTFSRDGADYVVAGTAGGSPTDPAWLSNVQANPDVAIEAEGRTFRAKASVADAADRDRLWNQHVAAVPKFAEYPEKVGRVIPMVRLTPIGKNSGG
jgi:deazaflavin-dependent oxidoreductase (nitroreductase family)